MKISVLYFASLRQAIGRTKETVELPDGSHVSDLVAEATRRHPAIEKFRASLMIARNREWAEATELLQDGDEVALLPPVSGG